MSLYHKYRPATFEEVWGNEKTVRAIKKQLSKPTKDIPHVFLFTGPSGCGKTTFARIIANELDCHGRDFSEVDTADFRGIDTARAIRSKIPLKPSAMSKARVWLLDECHKLTNDAQNALLKALEDPPEHAFFILCTTDPQKLIKTLKSRATSFAVTLLSEERIAKGLGEICAKEKMRVKPDILKKIASTTQGHVRAAVVELDKVISLDPEEQKETIAEAEAEEAQTIDLCRLLLKKGQWKKVSLVLKNLIAEPESARYAVAGYAKAVLLSSGSEESYDLLNIFTSRKYVDVYELTAMCAAHSLGYGLWDNPTQ